MFIDPTITWVPSGFSGYIWLDRKVVLKKDGRTDGRTNYRQTDGRTDGSTDQRTD